MTKMQTALASLVAVIPAAVLSVVLVFGFLGHFEQMSNVPILMVMAILALLCGVAVLVAPVLVLVGGDRDTIATGVRTNDAPTKSRAKAKDDDDESDFEPEDEDEMLATGEFETVDGDEDFGGDDEMLATGEFETVDSDEEFGGDDDEMLATGEFEAFDADDDFGDDDWDDDEKK